MEKGDSDGKVVHSLEHFLLMASSALFYSLCVCVLVPITFCWDYIFCRRLLFWVSSFWLGHVYLSRRWMGSRCGSVGREVVSDGRGPPFESSHWQTFISDNYFVTVKCIEKTKLKKKVVAMQSPQVFQTENKKTQCWPSLSKNEMLAIAIEKLLLRLQSYFGQSSPCQTFGRERLKVCSLARFCKYVYGTVIFTLLWLKVCSLVRFCKCFFGTLIYYITMIKGLFPRTFLQMRFRYSNLHMKRWRLVHKCVYFLKYRVWVVSDQTYIINVKYTI